MLCYLRQRDALCIMLHHKVFCLSNHIILPILHKLTAVLEHLRSQIYKPCCKFFAGITAAQYVKRL